MMSNGSSRKTRLLASINNVPVAGTVFYGGAVNRTNSEKLWLALLLRRAGEWVM
jgi:hypothetical protein